MKKHIPIPEPYATKAFAMVKPWHPFFKFTLESEEDALVFTIAAQNILCRDTWLHDVFGKQTLTGYYPMADFHRMADIPRQEGESDKDYQKRQSDKAFEAFALCFFGSVNRCVRDMLTDAHLDRMNLIRHGCLDVRETMRWIREVTHPLRAWFDWQMSYNQDHLSMIAFQPKAYFTGRESTGWFVNDGGDIRPWHAFQPMQWIGLDIQNLDRQCQEVTREQGIQAAEYQVRKLIYESMTNALYFMRFHIPDPVKSRAAKDDGPRITFARNKLTHV